MSRQRASIFLQNSQQQQTFRFDSHAEEAKGSRSKSGCFINRPIDLDLSQRTSQYVRFAEGKNQNILELLQESEEDKKTNKVTKEDKKDLWDFFAKFNRQSNPDITISEISLIARKNQKGKKQWRKKENIQYNDISQKVQKKEKNAKKNIQSQTGSQQSYHVQICHQNNKEQSPNDFNRYPKRNRVQPAKYWLGQKYEYKYGVNTGMLKKNIEKEIHDK